MRKVIKMLMPLMLLALLVGMFAFSVSAEAPTALADGVIATKTGIDGSVVEYTDSKTLVTAMYNGYTDEDVFDIYADVNFTQNNLFSVAGDVTVRLHGVTLSYSNTKSKADKHHNFAV